MDPNDVKNASKTTLAQQIATRTSDPWFFGSLNYLPNPDEVLRKLGRSQEVFDAIASDAHVLGELRSVRAGLLSYEWRLQAGGERPADLRALELCEQIMARRPAPGLRWGDIIWSMAQAVFRGYSVHEVVWEREGRYLLPAKIIDRPQRRFVFGTSNELRLLTRENMVSGEELGPLKWLLTRHMHSHQNPYGVAVFSPCFWPYTFKHSGFKYFVKFAEKYGFPWAIGKYPAGTSKSDQDALADALAKMVEDAVAAVPADANVDLQSTSIRGDVIHERLINLCNRELSKALTSQTLATEIQGEGSRAASQTHREREESVNQSDRDMVADTFSELFAWITELNIPDAAPPRFEFYEECEARQEWVEVFDTVRPWLKVPKAFAHERLQIPIPGDDEEVLPSGDAEPGAPPASFAKPSALPDEATMETMLESFTDAELSAQGEGLLQPLITLVREVGPDQAIEQLEEAYPRMDDQQLQDFLARVMYVSEIWGRANAGSG